MSKGLNNKNTAKKGETRNTVSSILRYIRPYAVPTVISAVFSALSAVIMLYIPIMAGKMIDVMLNAGNVDFAVITRYSAYIAVAAVVSSLLQWCTDAINNAVVYRVMRDVRNQAFEQLERLPLSYIDSHPFGDTASRLVSDVDSFADGLLLGFSQLFSGVVTILCTLGFMLALQPIIAVIVLVLTPISVFASRYIASSVFKRFKERSEILGEETALINECFSNHSLIKAFSQEQVQQAKFDEINNRLEKCSVQATFFSALTNPVTRFVNSVVYAAVAVAGALLCISDVGIAAAFTVGSLTASLAYASRYTKPFNEISGVIAEMQNSLACAGRFFALLNEPCETDSPNVHLLPTPLGKVTMNNVSFSYDKTKELITDFNLDVSAGMHVAIVGPTGCGKTTLINLLMRFYDTDDGEISVDNTNVREVTRQSLRKGFGMVLQETWLKTGTVRENIAFGKPDATDDEIIAAAKSANAHSFIMRLPQGYDTPVGEDGLSQGQRQLLCISRVMLKMPPMLILDEATASIDTRTEMIISRAFDALTHGKTSFVVAHRLSTIRNADLILVMKDGKVVEQGTHAMLLSRGGFYSQLLNSIEQHP